MSPEPLLEIIPYRTE